MTGADRGGRQYAGVAIAPITIRLVAYGQKANVAAVRTRAISFLKEELGTVDDSWFAELDAATAHAEIVAGSTGCDVELRKPTKSQAGIAITLPEVHERMAGEWLNELPAAKTCVVFATWHSARDGLDWRLLIAEGDRWPEGKAP